MNGSTLNYRASLDALVQGALKYRRDFGDFTWGQQAYRRLNAISSKISDLYLAA
jgi:hypothetical protein